MAGQRAPPVRPDPQAAPGSAGAASNAAGPHSLFFALLPGRDVRGRIAAIAAAALPPALKARTIRAARYHLTLRFLGRYREFPGAVQAQAVQAAETVRAPAFELRLDTIGSFGGRCRVWWLGCRDPAPALLDLSRGLDAALAGGGLAFDPRPLVPHLTIARDAIGPPPGAQFQPLQWQVGAFALMRSSGPDHDYAVVAEWPLQA